MPIGQQTKAKSVPVTFASDQAMPLATGHLVDTSGTSYEVKYAFANIAQSQTASSVVAAVTSKKIRVLALTALAGASATTVLFSSASTAKTMTFANGANGGFVLPFSPGGWFETVAGEALTATTGAGATTGIQVVYIEV